MRISTSFSSPSGFRVNEAIGCYYLQWGYPALKLGDDQQSKRCPSVPCLPLECLNIKRHFKTRSWTVFNIYRSQRELDGFPGTLRLHGLTRWFSLKQLVHKFLVITKSLLPLKDLSLNLKHFSRLWVPLQKWQIIGVCWGLDVCLETGWTSCACLSAWFLSPLSLQVGWKPHNDLL